MQACGAGDPGGTGREPGARWGQGGSRGAHRGHRTNEAIREVSAELEMSALTWGFSWGTRQKCGGARQGASAAEILTRGHFHL